MPPRKVVSRRSFKDPNLIGSRRPAGITREYLGTVEAEWHCNSCGNPQPIPGGTKKCPSCGHPKDDTENYQPPSKGAAYLTAQQLADMGVNPALHNSDEKCPYCGSKLKPNTEVCPNCRGNIEDVLNASRRCHYCGRETNNDICPNCGSATQPKIEPDTEAAPVFTLPIEIPNPENIPWKAVGSVFLTLLLIGSLVLAFWPRNESAVVTQANWVSTVYLQEYQYNQHNDWSIPAGGDYLSEEQRIHHYDKVYDHTEPVCNWESVSDGYETENYTDYECESVYSHTDQICYDDGTCDNEAQYETVCENVQRERQVEKFKQVEVCNDVDVYRDEPRYATWYTYKIWEWVGITPAVATGTGFEPSWPTDYQIDDMHKETGRDQKYSSSFQVKDKTYTYAPRSFEEYRQYQIGSEWIIKRSGGIILEVKPNKTK